MDATRPPNPISNPRRRLEALVRDLRGEIDAELRWLNEVQHLLISSGTVTKDADRQAATLATVEGLHAIRTINGAVRALTAEAIQTAEQLTEPSADWARKTGAGKEEC